MNVLRVLIADDEQVARRRLRRLLSCIAEVECVGECSNGVDVLARLTHDDVDVLLLDIKMPRLDGLETAALLKAERPVIIFTTAYPEHAVDAYDKDVVDYVLKPVEEERLCRALERAQRRLNADNDKEAESHANPSGETKTPARLAVSTRKGVVLINPNDISHAVLDGETCILHANKTRYVTDLRLNELERSLASTRFERVQRRALVNLEHIKRLEPTETGGYIAHLSDDEQVEVSRQAARRLRQRWKLPNQ